MRLPTPPWANSFSIEGSTLTAGNELWRSDGTAAGTFMVKDIRPGSSSSSISNTIILLSSTSRELCLFQANNGTNGSEVWVSNGTAAGTMLLKDIYPGTNSGGFYDPCILGSRVLFRANNGKSGYELWITDGTPGGTVMLKDIYPGSSSSSPYQMTRLGKKVFFRATNGTSTSTIPPGAGNELWETDGTALGTKLLKDIRPGTSSSSPKHLALCGRYIYFWADNGKTGSELWVTNGTSLGTTFVKDCRVGSTGSSPYSSSRVYAWTAFGNKLVWSMTSYTNTGGSLGTEPWVSDSTGPGTFLLKDIRSGSSSSYARYMDTVGGTYSNPKAVILGYTYDGTNGYEPWITNGTSAGTVLLKDICPGSSSGYGYYVSRPTFFPLAVMRGFHPATGNEPWICDGTNAGTKLACNIATTTGTAPSSPAYFVDNYHQAYFQANPGSGQELYRSNGLGCNMVKNINPTSTGADIYGSRMEFWRDSGQPHKATSLGKWFFFKGNNGVNGYELWKTDGTNANTVMVQDLAPGPASGLNYGYLVTMGGMIYFTGSPTGSSSNMNLYKTDGTAVTLVKAGFNRYWYNPLVVTNRIFFGGSTAANGVEPWVTNGTMAGTHLIRDIKPGTANAYWYEPCQLKGEVYFRAYNATSTYYALWKTNGTSAGTIQLTPSTNYSFGHYAIPFNGRVYFRGRSSTTGYEIWATDGTPLGTGIHKDIYIGSSSGYFQYPCVLGRYLYFRATNGTSSTTIPPGAGYELWRTDGLNTSLFKDCRPGSGSGSPTYMTNIGDRHMAFSADNGTHGRELWISNGTVGGTKMICDINTGPAASNPQYFCLTNGHLLFRAYNDPFGYEPWTLPWCHYQSTGFVTATAQMIGFSATTKYDYHLGSSDPRLGGTLFLRVHNGNSGIVLGGLATQKPLHLGGGAFIYFDIFMGILLNFPLNATGTASLPIPNDAGLIGLHLTLQAFTHGKGTSFGVDFTNGVYYTLGDL